eukprot:TRINITY_DN31999_c0_g1_i1.p1 TRINITY_DN31999_c0_g1~~TRINITY_DN31999_c0_g1_i1.p1  ORF type:complete len:100 (-),score=12.69 TRINITY_DN31999_c0_g1_i1:131-430(-)
MSCNATMVSERGGTVVSLSRVGVGGMMLPLRWIRSYVNEEGCRVYRVDSSPAREASERLIKDYGKKCCHDDLKECEAKGEECDAEDMEPGGTYVCVKEY